MKLALLGADEDAWAIARAVRNNPELDLVWACIPRKYWPDLHDMAPGLRPTATWEALLDGRLVDAVIVASAAPDEVEERGEQIRRLVQEKIPLLVAHPVVPSILIYYEIDSALGEPPSILLPYLPWRWHPAVQKLSRLCQNENQGIGQLEQVVCERFLPQRTQALVCRQFAVDADLAQFLAGELTHLGAMAPGATAFEAAPEYNNLGVQAFGRNKVLVRWSVGPVEVEPGAKVSLIGSRGKAILEAPAGAFPWKLEVRLRNAGTPTLEEFAPWNPAVVALEQLAHALSGQPVTPTWHDATQAVELAETIERSLLKRRTIEVRPRSQGEAGQFKGTMTALGCGLLLLSVFFVILGLILGNRPFELILTGRIMIFASAGLLGLFLLLQFLSLIIPQEPANQANEISTESEDEMRSDDLQN